jgi:hypothetical protein
MEKQNNERAVITGASSGIGRDLAELFARDKRSLVLVARREERLRELAADLQSRYGIEAEVMPLDLSDQSAPQRLMDMIDNAGFAITDLVNNAGFGARGEFAGLETQRQVDMLQVNVTALTHLSRLILPDMLERGRGRILNVASTAAFQPGPFMAVYYASKSYVLSFSNALSEELEGSGVTVTCLCPGATRTEFQEESDMENTLLFKYGVMDAAGVARAGYDGMRRGKRMVVPGLPNKVLAKGSRLIPRKLSLKVVRKLQG